MIFLRGEIKMQIIHIPPVGIKIEQAMEMYLAHLVLKYGDTEPYLRSRVDISYKIVDNSFNENNKSSSLEDLERACSYMKANEVVLPDCLGAEKNIKLIQESILEIETEAYSLRHLNKMAVLHADTWSEALNFIDYFDRVGNSIHVIGIPKFTASLTPFGKGRVELAKLIKHKQVHFLGSNGFSELVGVDLRHIRSMDTGWFLKNLNMTLETERVNNTINLEEPTLDSNSTYKRRVLEVTSFLDRWCTND